MKDVANDFSGEYDHKLRTVRDKDGDEVVCTLLEDEMEPNDGGGKPIKMNIAKGSYGPLMSFEGYGDACHMDGGFPVAVDYFDGKLQLLVYGDINSDSPTHSISLEGAKLSARWEMDDEGNCPYCGAKCFEGQGCDEQLAGGFNNEEKDDA